MPPAAASVEVQALTEPSPCDGCKLHALCAQERVACRAFSQYVDGRRWRGAPRDANKAQYAAIFATSARKGRQLRGALRTRA
jgi:hypothetical protein